MDVFVLNVEPLPGEHWRPSNGTVGYSFVTEICGTYARDQDDNCPILVRSFHGEAVEWRSTASGPICVAYSPAGESIPRQQCAHTMALPLGADTDKKER
ncbi:hypothetical protein [Achromobacter sp. UMC71]|uniref:hypothetical protein n=1 Tax=Achromobacter sp. UMC71 TaxID=1862320 RepID=UPI0016029E9D|nr:hypothetical protein [Achromobacter sp. UMC71]